MDNERLIAESMGARGLVQNSTDTEVRPSQAKHNVITSQHKNHGASRTRRAFTRIGRAISSYFGGQNPSIVTAWFTAGLFLVTTIYAVVSYAQLVEIRKQGNVAIAEVRPYIKVKRIELRTGNAGAKTLMWVNSEGGTVPELLIDTVVENDGRSVAQNIAVFYQFVVTPYAPIDWLHFVAGKESVFCASVISTEPSVANSSIAFPSESLTLGDNILASSAPEGHLAGAVVVCVNYTDALGARHQTRAFATLSVVDDGYIVNDVEVDYRKLRLYRVNSGDHAD